MKPLNIVLVEPQIPQNTGNISRTCAATGARLHLVGPMGFTVDDKKLKRAGLDYWHLLDITYYEGLTDFFARNEGPFYYFTTKAPQRYTDVAYPDGAYLVFGREDAGLPEALLRKKARTCVRLPMIPDARSLNLSNTVAVGVYEALRSVILRVCSTPGTCVDMNGSEQVSKTAVLTDSASDIPRELEEKYGIDILPFSIVVDGQSYTERVDFTNEPDLRDAHQSRRHPQNIADHDAALFGKVLHVCRRRLYGCDFRVHQFGRFQRLQARPAWPPRACATNAPAARWTCMWWTATPIP